MAYTIHQGFMSTLSIYEKQKLRGCLNIKRCSNLKLSNCTNQISIPYINSTDNFILRKQIWSHLENYFRNYRYLNFWASNAKIILKCQIASPDGLSFLSVAQKQLDQMSWIFVYVNLKVLKIGLRQNICR